MGFSGCITIEIPVAKKSNSLLFEPDKRESKFKLFNAGIDNDPETAEKLTPPFSKTVPF